jgi:hypothetical protein
MRQFLSRLYQTTGKRKPGSQVPYMSWANIHSNKEIEVVHHPPAKDSEQEEIQVTHPSGRIFSTKDQINQALNHQEK